jgi:uncharacterized protein YqfB (UPF0267 family)
MSVTVFELEHIAKIARQITELDNPEIDVNECGDQIEVIVYQDDKLLCSAELSPEWRAARAVEFEELKKREAGRGNLIEFAVTEFGKKLKAKGGDKLEHDETQSADVQEGTEEAQAATEATDKPQAEE